MYKELLNELESFSNESVKKRYIKSEETQPFFGVMRGDINKLAKKYKDRYDLAIPLWNTNNIDAQLLAIQLFDPKKITSNDVTNLINDKTSLTTLAPFTEKVLSKTKYWQEFEELFINSDSKVLQRMAWLLRVKYFGSKKAKNEEIDKILVTINNDMKNTEEIVRWAMNYCLVTIAVSYPAYLDKCLEIGTELGVYKNQVVPKGCTSAYAPEWINAIIKNKRR